MSKRSVEAGARKVTVVGIFHRLYKLFLSPLFGNACRFQPSCSDYALEAVERYGWGRGGVLAAKRIFRCRPGNPGGVDPVP